MYLDGNRFSRQHGDLPATVIITTTSPFDYLPALVTVVASPGLCGATNVTLTPDGF